MRPEARKEYLDMPARVFIRAVRYPHQEGPAPDEEYELSEGQATSLLVEREAMLNALGWRLWRACSQAEDYLGIIANVPELGDAMNAWKANAYPDPTLLKAADAAEGKHPPEERGE